MINSNKSAFILIKPDGLNNVEIKNEIMQKTSDYEMQVANIYKVFVDNESIRQIWPYCQTDIVCMTLMERYLKGNELMLLDLVAEYGALDKVVNIKKEIRKKYAVSPFQNILHTPSNAIELERDYNILLNRKNNKKYVNETIIGDFISFKEYSEEDFIQCAIFLEEFMKITRFELFFQIMEILPQRYKIYLLDDDIHDGKFVAGVLLDFFEEFTLEKSYYIALGTNYIGEFPLIATNSMERVNQIKKYLLQYNIEIRFSK